MRLKIRFKKSAYIRAAILPKKTLTKALGAPKAIPKELRTIISASPG